MVGAMTRFHRQRLVGILFLILASAAVLLLHFRYATALPRYAFLSGWVLFGSMLLLAVYNLRKKLPFVPLGTSEGWLQVHIYVGFLSVVLFLAHARFHLPTGWVEGILASLYLMVAGSGIAGLVLSRVLPRRLATRGGEVIYEKIPALRYSLREKAEVLAFGLKGAGGSPAVAQLYAGTLARFFLRPRNFWRHLADSRRPLNAILSELDELRRYLNESERGTLQELAQLVTEKDGLDYHHALQTTLRAWLFVHLPLTYSLMLFTVVHMVLVFAFSGGAR
jgi:hypothetical protein